jgi:hypothetical protein
MIQCLFSCVSELKLPHRHGYASKMYLVATSKAILQGVSTRYMSVLCKAVLDNSSKNGSPKRWWCGSTFCQESAVESNYCTQYMLVSLGAHQEGATLPVTRCAPDL